MDNKNITAQPKVLKIGIGSVKSHELWLVDDSWFEGKKEGGKIFNISSILHLDENHHETVQSLLDEINTIEEDSDIDIDISLSADFGYLKTILSVCSSFNFVQVNLCNFEYFKENYSIINNSKSTIFLDIMYDRYISLDRSLALEYGLYLLLELMQRDMPRANIVFITGWPNKVVEFVERELTSENKYLDDTQKISAFNIKYSKESAFQYLRLYLKEIEDLERKKFSLAFDLLDANFTYMIHPQNVPHISEYSQISKDLYCYSIFKKDDPLSIQSYEALFLASDRHNGSWRRIKIESFVELLKLANITIETPLKDSEAIEIPMQPGMLFIVNLIDFLNSMKIEKINLEYQAEKQEVDLSFEVREIERFSSAILTGGGRNSSCKFRYLMGCRKDIICDMGEKLQYGMKNVFADWADKKQLQEQEKEIIKETILTWNPRLLDGKQEESLIYPAFLRWDRDWKSNDNKYIHIKWDSKSCKSKQDPLDEFQE
jgi:hypothetical protein